MKLLVLPALGVVELLRTVEVGMYTRDPSKLGERRHGRSVALCASLVFLAGSSCRPTPPATASLGFNPCCALVVGEVGALTDPRILISQRRGPPAEDRWELLGDSHKPANPPGSPDFVWRPMTDIKEVVLPTGGNGYQVHNLILPLGSRLVDMIQNADGLWRSPRELTILEQTVPSGRPGGPLGADQGRAGIFRRVSGVAVGNKLHICAVETQGQIERNIFDPATDSFEGWTDVEMNSSSEVGRFVDVACAAVVNPTTGLEELHVCGATDDGGLWHSMESPARTFSPFGDVKAQSGDVGNFSRVDCAGSNGQLHVVGVTTDGRAWHTARIPSGWRAFDDVADKAPLESTNPVVPARRFSDVAVGFCNYDVPADGPRDVSQLNIVLTDRGPNAGAQTAARIWHTIRAANPVRWSEGSMPNQWRPMRDLAPIINRGLDPAPPTSNPMLWGGFSLGFRPFRAY